MALNKRRLERSKNRSRGGGGGNFHRLRDGRNLVRIFSFPHEVAEEDFTKGIYKKGEVEVGDTFDEVEREVASHFLDDGSLNCIGSGCEHCAEAKKLSGSKSKSDQKLGRQLSARRRFYVNLVDIEESDAGVQLSALPQSVFNAVLNYIMDPDFGEEILGPEGRDFIIDRDSKESPDKMYAVRLRDEKKCEELSADLQDDVTDLFTCKALEPGWSSNSDLNEAEEKDDETKKEQTRRSSRARDKDDDEPKKSGKRSSKKKDNDFEDDDTSGDKAPWDEGKEDAPAFKEKDKVTFEDAGETLTGKIVEFDDSGDVAAVEVGNEIYDIPVVELTAAKKSSRRR